MFSGSRTNQNVVWQKNHRQRQQYQCPSNRIRVADEYRWQVYLRWSGVSCIFSAVMWTRIFFLLLIGIPCFFLIKSSCRFSNSVKDIRYCYTVHHLLFAKTIHCDWQVANLFTTSFWDQGMYTNSARTKDMKGLVLGE